MRAEFPDAFQFLFEKARYKIAYGGRGAGKSQNFARALLILGAQRPLRILCAREIQKSIADSVHYLLKEQIRELGLQSHYTVQKSTILGRNGTSIIFAGLKHNIASIKSLEACDVVWVEEAHVVSKNSWDTLIPTIRKEGSEIWVSFNPELKSDNTWSRFVADPPANAIVRKVNWDSNPWFPSVLRAEMETLKEKDPDAWLHVWEGNCISILDGAIYANELRKVEAENRITRVPYDPTKACSTFWDLGFGDSTCIWIAQAVGFEFHLIDYIEGSQKPLNHYLRLLQERGYIYDTDWLPHDGNAKTLGTGRSVVEMMRAAGRRVRVVPQLSIADGINAARTVFPNCWFDADKCADGLQALRHYRYEKDEDLNTYKPKPLHDWASHGSDAFRYFAVAMRTPQIERKKELDDLSNQYAAYGSDGWMA